MRSLYTVTLIVVLGIFGSVLFDEKPSVCAEPLSYSIGQVDEGFGISSAVLERTVLEAESIWEDAFGHDLFLLDKTAKLTINLKFDERQAQTLFAQNARDDISIIRSSYDALVSRYTQLVDTHQTRADVYDNDFGVYNSRLASYNKSVNDINKKGSATDEELSALETERQALEGLAFQLESFRSELNSLANQINGLSLEINEISKQLNITVSEYNKTYAAGRQFDQGVYSGNEITIYQFESVPSLRIVLAHELGHAIGLGHVDDKHAIMHSVLSEQNFDNPTITQADKNLLLALCKESL